MSSIAKTGLVRINRQGPPSVLEYTTDFVGEPAEHEVRLRQQAIALNFVDVLFRNGSFPLPQLPATIGVEAAGIVEAVGSGVTDFAVGDRVAYYFSLGAYAEQRLIRTADLVRLPNDISFDVAASLVAKGLTARMLVKQAYAVQRGDIVLVHAAAGGVGSLVSKWARALGAIVIGTVGNAAKKELALRAGIDHVIALDTEDMGAVVRSITNDRGIQAVFDGVGKATFGISAPLVKPGGTIVLYGSASGNPSIDAAYLTARDIHLVRPSLGQYLPDRKSIDTATAELFEAMRTGMLGTIQPTVYPLAAAAQAHHDLESSLTTGSVILQP